MIGALAMHRYRHPEYQALLQKKHEKRSQKSKPVPHEPQVLLEILLSQKAYFPGSNVQGIVNLHLKSSDLNACKLVFQIKGMMVYKEKEKSFNSVSSMAQASPINEEAAVHMHIFYHHRFILEEAREGLESGFHIIPFEFKLHEKLPRTLKICDGDLDFECCYKLSVFWQKGDKEKVKFQIILPIIQRPPILVMNYMISKASGEFKRQICCFGGEKDKVGLELFVAGNLIRNDESLECFCKIKKENIRLEGLCFRKLEVVILRLISVNFKGIEKKFIKSEVFKQQITLNRENTKEIGPDTLKADFKLEGVNLSSISLENKYIRVNYVIIVKAAGFKSFFKEVENVVKNQGYLFFLGHKDEELLKELEVKFFDYFFLTL